MTKSESAVILSDVPNTINISLAGGGDVIDNVLNQRRIKKRHKAKTKAKTQGTRLEED